MLLFTKGHFKLLHIELLFLIQAMRTSTWGMVVIGKAGSHFFWLVGSRN